MSESLDKYRYLLRELIFIRWIHCGFESEEEDQTLEKMDEVWWKLTEEERETMQALPTQSLLRSQAERIIQDTDLSLGGPRRYIFDNVKEAA